MATKSQKRKAVKAAEKVIKKSPKWVIVTAIILAIILVGGYFLYTKVFKKPKPLSGELTFHFMMLGNNASGDSIYIKAGDNDILIDAGSKEESIDDIQTYVNQYVTDNKFEFVIITHGDTDHIDGFAKTNGSIFDLYECDIIITAPRTSKTTATYNRYLSELADEVNNGAKNYTALQCYKEEDGAKKEYALNEDGSMKMEILYNYYYENETQTQGKENNYSVCVQFHHGDRKFLFTGDLEEKGEEYLVEYNNLSQVDLYKAGHHGSAGSSTNELLSVIQPKICVVSCAIRENEYGFPKESFLSRVANYTSNVYVTTMAETEYLTGEDLAKGYGAMNGNIIVSSSASKPQVEVECSHSNTLLKDTAWCKAERPTVTWTKANIFA